MGDERVLHVLRVQAWERAKGELEGVLQTYYPQYPKSFGSNHDKLDNLVKEFVKQVEDEGLTD